MSKIVFPPCPREGCTFIGHHWHNNDGPTVCPDAENCADPWSKDNDLGCVSARVPAAPPEPESSARLVIPEITDEEVEACFEDAWGPRRDAMRGECRSLLEAYRARLIESLDAWKPVPAGATIPVGVRYRCDYAESGDARETTRLTHRLVPGEDAYFVRASDWGKVILPEPEPDEGERLVEALAQRLKGVADALHGFLDDLPAYDRSYWPDTARQILAGLEDDGFTIEPKPRGEAS